MIAFEAHQTGCTRFCNSRKFDCRLLRCLGIKVRQKYLTKFSMASSSRSISSRFRIAELRKMQVIDANRLKRLLERVFGESFFS